MSLGAWHLAFALVFSWIVIGQGCGYRGSKAVNNHFPRFFAEDGRPSVCSSSSICGCRADALGSSDGQSYRVASTDWTYCSSADYRHHGRLVILHFVPSLQLSNFLVTPGNAAFQIGQTLGQQIAPDRKSASSEKNRKTGKGGRVGQHQRGVGFQKADKILHGQLDPVMLKRSELASPAGSAPVGILVANRPGSLHFERAESLAVITIPVRRHEGRSDGHGSSQDWRRVVVTERHQSGMPVSEGQNLSLKLAVISHERLYGLKRAVVSGDELDRLRMKFSSGFSV
ncbi:hypothetical protein [Mesorhizobium sp. M0959]|uniref:hypothetical protein n=1 Tax=unclassified Mesorhizobium TaxID=325217 RepID=UPI00333A6D2C